jgi:predicted PhzF superfamily epimerase YddE/YHI9
VAEERLCGHATLASAHILSYLGVAPGPDGIYHFQTRWAGELTARVREGGQIELDFPADDLTSLEGEEKQKIVSAVERALPVDAAFSVENVWRGNLDVIVGLSPRDGSQLREAKINIDELASLFSYIIRLK